MIMPSRHVSHSSISIESIPENENSCEEEDLPADNRVQLQVVGDGTFELPKLNKVEVTQNTAGLSNAYLAMSAPSKVEVPSQNMLQTEPETAVR